LFGGGPCPPLYIRGDRVTWKVLAEYSWSPTTTQSGSFLCTAASSMPIRVVTKEVRYIHELSLTLEHSMSISSPAVPGLTFNTSLESGTHCAQSTHEDYNCLKVLSCKTFRRLVVDAYVYRKHCKFRGCSVVLTLQLNLHDTSTIGDEKGNTSSTIAARGCSHGRAYDKKQSTAGRYPGLSFIY